LATKTAGVTSTVVEKKDVTRKSVAKKAAIKEATVASPVQKKTTSPKTSTTIAAPVAAAISTDSREITFKLRFSTKYGQSLYISGNHSLLGVNDLENSVPLSYIDKDFWGVTITVSNVAAIIEDITYNYVLKNTDGSISYDWGSDKTIDPSLLVEGKTLILIHGIMLVTMKMPFIPNLSRMYS